MTTQLERFIRMESEVKALKESFEEHKAETTENLSAMNKKLDSLLALRNKGAGVLWVLAGAAAIAFEFFRYFFTLRHG